MKFNQRKKEKKINTGEKIFAKNGQIDLYTDF